MRKAILSLVALGLFSGVAAADRHSGGWSRGDRGGRVIVHNNNSGWGHSWNGGVRVTTPRYNYGTYHRNYGRGYVARRPIYVQRPLIRHRYVNYYERPALIVENYPPMDGYIWVAGAWQWNGYEWIWQPGHYEPDPAYTSGYYNDGSFYNDGY